MKVLFSLFFLISSSAIFAQDFDNRVFEKQYNCSEISYNTSILFQQFYEEQKLDSAHQLLVYWRAKCGLNEPVFRARVLLSLKEGMFHDSLLTDFPLQNLYSYQHRSANSLKAEEYDNEYYKEFYGYIPLNQKFDQFTFKEAGHLKSNYAPGTIEFLLCEFYSGKIDSLLDKVGSKEYKNTVVGKNYSKIVTTLLNRSETHFSLLAGLWVPTGGAKLLGNHPEIGLGFGVKHKKMNYDLVTSFRFLKSQTEYYAIRGNNSLPELTDHFVGLYFGFECGRDVFVKKANEVQLIAGLGLDGFDIFKPEPNVDSKGTTTFSYNFNLGTSYRYYFNGYNYISFKIKYNIVDYRLNNRIDFTGNSFSFQIAYGALGNAYRQSGLKRMGYKVRQ